MAKSLRSKTKRNHRAAKRTKGDYAVADAARLGRLNEKLNAIKSGKAGKTDEEDDMQEAEDVSPDQPTTTTTTTESLPDTTTMQVDEKKVSTHGPRNSRREEWRLSKGLTAFPTSKGMNRQGGLAAKRKPGRSQRRR